ncbi:MAG: glycosyltransferase [Microbacterium sp.]|nr:MAG: glycosyltransferase [Microbacterium sp.]
MADRPAVSVVVPMFSTGPYIRPLLDCLDRQEPPDGGFEALLIDDGSTDGTRELIGRWAARRPWADLIGLPPSGWPSRPRNVGVDRARGEFVFFVDHDDWLAADALRRMTDFARRHESDVVVGWMAGIGRHVPVRLFASTVADAHPPATPLQDSMTVHALFRTTFLHDTGLRFDESLRRLEDHLFMATAYTHARRVSVLADAPVYVHTAREDGENAGFRTYRPTEYYAALERAIAVVRDGALAAAERNAYLGRWMRLEMIDRLSSAAVRSLPAEERDAFVAEVQRLLRDMPADALRALPAAYADRARELREASPADFARLTAAPGARSVAAAPRGMRARLTRLARAARDRVVDALPHAGTRVQRRAVTWARNPSTLVRDAAAAGAIVAALAATGFALVAPAASVVLVAAATLVRAWLAIRSLSPWATAITQLLALAPAVVAAAAHTSAWAGAACAAAAALVAFVVAADHVGRRRDVRSYPAREGGLIARTGRIGLTAFLLAGVITATTAFAGLR